MVQGCTRLGHEPCMQNGVTSKRFVLDFDPNNAFAKHQGCNQQTDPQVCQTQLLVAGS